jgi:hypothetical protein
LHSDENVLRQLETIERLPDMIGLKLINTLIEEAIGFFIALNVSGAISLGVSCARVSGTAAGVRSASERQSQE